MECNCGKKAVLHRRYEGRAFCGDCLCRDVEKKFSKEFKKYGVKKGDTVAVGLSGGKDSAVLLSLIAKEAGRVGFETVAAIVDEGISGYRNESIEKAKELAKQMGVRCEVFSFSDKFSFAVDDIEKLKQENKKVKFCTYCGVFRRHALNKLARKVGADFLAIGHNFDDEVQSVMLNVIRGDVTKMARLGNHKETKNTIRRIKPLRNIPEREVAAYALLKKLQYHDGECPHSFDNMRRDVRDVLNELENKYPGTKQQVMRFYEKISAALPEEKKSMKECISCGDITSQERCRACEFLERLNPIKK